MWLSDSGKNDERKLKSAMVPKITNANMKTFVEIGYFIKYEIIFLIDIVLWSQELEAMTHK